jgi:hypothetical protein
MTRPGPLLGAPVRSSAAEKVLPALQVVFPVDLAPSVPLLEYLERSLGAGIRGRHAVRRPLSRVPMVVPVAMPAAETDQKQDDKNEEYQKDHSLHPLASQIRDPYNFLIHCEV